MRIVRTVLAAAGLCVVALPALAHTGHDATSGLAAGFAHPFMGLDHILAMVAVGVLAARCGGRALLALPAAFLVAMVAGGAAGLSGIALPLIETGIAGSVLVLGLAILFSERLAAPVAAVLVAGFGLFHGHAHGTELVHGVGFAGYAAGFVAATALLHAIGIAIARASEFRAPALGLARASGAAFALAGAALLVA
jgi:urease accessory protein